MNLPRSFFDRHHLDVARDLIGCAFVWDRCAGIVAETEGYAAADDEASHLWTRPSARAFFEEHPPGTAYTYLNYGMYWLANVLAADGIVLLRALEPTAGIAKMRERRDREKLTDLCSGPGKLGMALGLDGSHHGEDLCSRRGRGFRAAEGAAVVDTCVRIGITKAVDYPWRFLLRDSPHVSVAPKKKKR